MENHDAIKTRMVSDQDSIARPTDLHFTDWTTGKEVLPALRAS